MSRAGKILMILGGLLLVVCGASVPFWRKLSSGRMTLVFAALIAAAVMIVAGEMLRYSGRVRGERHPTDFMDYYRQAAVTTQRDNKKTPSRDEARYCAFCGTKLMATGLPVKLEGVIDLTHSESQVGKCEECGKIVCPQCAFRKGTEMGLRSFRCPGCGGRVA